MPLAVTLTMLTGKSVASQPLTIVVPFAPGASADGITRIIAQQVTKNTGQTVVVDNRAGANGITAAIQTKRAPADGRTVILSNVGTDALNASLYEKLPYDSLKDFTTISLLWRFPSVLAVPSASEARSVKDLVKLARDTSGGLTYGSAGAGSGGHLLGEMFRIDSKAPMIHVPYRGMAPALTDLMGGRLHFTFASYSAVSKQVESGRLRVLAVAAERRLKALPDVPTLAESGMAASIVLDNWFGISAPAGTPKVEVERLQKAFSEAVKDPALVAQLAAQGVEAVGSTAAEYDALIRRDHQRLATLVKTLGVKAE
jgi:tripartite-type tricarboxylate transporter receptor subunit TctC